MNHEHPTTEASTEDPNMGGGHGVGENHMMCMTVSNLLSLKIWIQ